MKILVSDDVSMKGVELLRENGYEVDVKKNLDEQGLIDCIGTLSDALAYLHKEIDKRRN